MSRALEVRINGYTGKDILLNLLPHKIQARSVAKRVMRGMWKGVDVDTIDVLIHMPFGSYRVTDTAGHVEEYTGPVTHVGTAGL